MNVLKSLTSMNAFKSFFVPVALEKPKPEDHKHHRHGLEEHKIVDTQPFRSCLVSTTLNDVVPVQVNDRRTGKKHNASCIFLQFSFGPQKADSDKRIKAMKLEINVVESSSSAPTSEVCDHDQILYCTTCQIGVADPCGKQKPDSSSSRSTTELEIRGRYPICARSKAEMVQTTTHKGINISPEFQGVNVGNANIGEDQQYNIPNAMVMESFPNGPRGTIWQFYENDVYKSGLPATVTIAMVVQAEGQPFDIQLKFSGKCPLFGMFSLRAKVAMQVNRELLELPTPALEEYDSDCGLDDIESDAFKNWVKTETQNHWAETVEYE